MQFAALLSYRKLRNRRSYENSLKQDELNNNLVRFRGNNDSDKI